MTVSGGELLARSLQSLGIADAFVLHGGHLDAFLVACEDAQIRLTDTRHEASAGHAATAYARATGDIGVCVITAGPGFTNAVTAMTDAHLDAAPVLFIAGATPLRETETNALQGGFDQIAMAAPVTKWAHRVTNIERIPDLVDKAVRTALSGRPGPVYLEVPIDVMFAPCSEGVKLPTRPAFESKAAPSADAVNRILTALSTAERPAIIVGGGMLFSKDSGRRLAEFAEQTGIPVVYSGKANGVLPADHPYNLGNFGAIAAAAAGAKQPPDVIVQIGARGGMSLGGRSGSVVPHDAFLVHIDVDGIELGRIKTPDIAVISDSGEALAALTRGLAEVPVSAPESWVELLRMLVTKTSSRFDHLPSVTENGYIHPNAAAKAVVGALAPDTAITYDGGESPAWIVPLVRGAGPGLFTGNGYLGTLGVGPGYAIGMSLARPGKPVAVLTGDGAAGFNIGEFDTMARHHLPIVTVVFNNGSWGISRHGQQLVFGDDRTTVVKLERTDYHVAAQGLGCQGVLVTQVEDIEPEIRKAQASGVPTCINIMTDGDVIHPAIESMVAFTDDGTEIAIPYYENIPIR